MNDLRLVVVGAAGRMGRMLTQTIPDTLGVRLVAALESEGSPWIGQDSGSAFGHAPNGVAVTSDVATALAQADAVIDFSAPAATVALAQAAATAKVAHVIGTTGLSAEDLDAIAAESARDGRRPLRQYEPRRQSARGSGREGRPGARSRLGRGNRRNASSAQGRRAFRHGAAARRGRGAGQGHRLADQARAGATG